MAEQINRQEWLELYQPDSPDGDLPARPDWTNELAQSPFLGTRLDAIQKADDLIGAAIRGVDVPENLKSAILLRLAAAEHEDPRGPAELEEAQTSAGVVASRPTSTKSSRSRRRWMARIAVAATVLVSIGIAAFVWGRRDTGYVVAQAISAFDRDSSQVGWDRDSPWRPPGFAPQFYDGCGNVEFCGEKVFAVQFRDGSSRALVLFVSPSKLPRSMEYPGKIIRESRTVEWFRIGRELVCIAVYNGPNLDPFYIRTPNSMT